MHHLGPQTLQCCQNNGILKSMHENCSGETSGLCFCGDTTTCIVQDEPPADGPPSRVYFTRRTPAASRRPSHAWPACWPSHASRSVSSCFPCDLRLPLRLWSEPFNIISPNCQQASHRSVRTKAANSPYPTSHRQESQGSFLMNTHT